MAPLTEAPRKIPATEAEADAMMIAAYVEGTLEPHDHRLAAALRQQRDESRLLRDALRSIHCYDAAIWGDDRVALDCMRDIAERAMRLNAEKPPAPSLEPAAITRSG